MISAVLLRSVFSPTAQVKLLDSFEESGELVYEQALQQELKQEKEIGELKMRFVSTTSHEFRNPLATILATVETLSAYRYRMSDADIDKRLTKIRDQVDRMRSIMDDVLQLSRMQAGRVEFEPIEADLDFLCRDIIEEFESHPNNRSPRTLIRN